MNKLQKKCYLKMDLPKTMLIFSFRSTASTPSVQFDSERETLSNVDESERMAMLNTMLSFDSDLVTGAAMETPPPTVEVDEAEIGGVPSQVIGEIENRRDLKP